MKKTFNFEEIKHKRPAPGRPNSSINRIFGDPASETENPPYHRPAPRPAPFYTDSNAEATRAQDLQSWGRPPAGRQADIQPTNVGRANFRNVPMRAGQLEREDSRWWDWTRGNGMEPRSIGQAAEERMNKRGSSFQNLFHQTGDETAPSLQQNSRYSANPKHTRTVGIVPITSLKATDDETNGQYVGQQAPSHQRYLSQTQLDFARREQNAASEPPARPNEYRRAMPSGPMERAGSMWNLLHPHNDADDDEPAPVRRPSRPPSAGNRNGRHAGAWPNGPPYASSDHLEHDFGPPPMVNQAHFD